MYLRRSLYLNPNINLSLNFSIFTHRNRRELVRVCQHSILETCAYQLRIYKSALYSYNFYIQLQKLQSFGYLDLVKRRLMCIVLCPNSSLHCLPVYLSFALSSVFLPPKYVVLFWEEKLGTVSVEVFTFHVHLAFERHTGTEGRKLYFRGVFIL